MSLHVFLLDESNDVLNLKIRPVVQKLSLEN